MDVLNAYVQQWSALQTVRAAGLEFEDVFLTYLGQAGEAGEIEVEAYLSGLAMLPTLQRDLLAHAINEMLDGAGSTADGAHYSDQHAALSSGYSDYLRTLVLSPDGYDFTAPQSGDHNTVPLPAPEPEDPEEAEFRRCHALHESGLLDAGAEERFDRITRQARDHFGVSSASIALITEDAQVIKSVTGPLGQDLPRNLSLCSTTIEQDRTLIVTDAGSDPDWYQHPLVAGAPGVRFYAGHPVCTADGWRIGTLCVMDDRPRTFTEDDARALRRFAAQVQIEIWV